MQQVCELDEEHCDFVSEKNRKNKEDCLKGRRQGRASVPHVMCCVVSIRTDEMALLKGYKRKAIKPFLELEMRGDFLPHMQVEVLPSRRNKRAESKHGAFTHT